MSKIYTVYTYKFQHNNDLASMVALASMFRDGWAFDDRKAMFMEDGHRWFYLIKEVAHNA